MKAKAAPPGAATKAPTAVPKATAAALHCKKYN